jgi:GT2 family glycosyltransferase
MEQGVAQAPAGRLFVVIPVHNRVDFTRACLESLAAQTAPHTTVVVDDGSTDGTPEMVRVDFPKAALLHGDGDLWWTGATNVGVAWVLRRCGADDLVVTLNDDTVCPPEFLANLTRPAQRGSRMLLGSVAVSHRDSAVIVDGGVQVDWWRGRFVKRHSGDRLDEAFSRSGLEDVDVLPGRGTLVPVSAFRELGPYDRRRLPHYGADYEFSRRAARAGYRLAVNRSAVLVVHEENTGMHSEVSEGRLGTLFRSFTSRRSATNLRVRWNFARLAAPRKTLLPFLVCDLGRVVLGSIRRSATGRPLK